MLIRKNSRILTALTAAVAALALVMLMIGAFDDTTPVWFPVARWTTITGLPLCALVSLISALRARPTLRAAVTLESIGLAAYVFLVVDAIITRNANQNDDSGIFDPVAISVMACLGCVVAGTTLVLGATRSGSPVTLRGSRRA